MHLATGENYIPSISEPEPSEDRRYLAARLLE